MPELSQPSLPMLERIFPCLAGLKKSETDKIDCVNHTIIEEVQQDLGTLDFGKGITADSSLALWRERGLAKPLCGEFSFECKFKRRDDLHEKTVEQMRHFFVALQQDARDWLSLGTTKTGLVYRLKGNSPPAHE